jgi:asparagine synthetase B (glutamine-hydrolysing)
VTVGEPSPRDAPYRMTPLELASDFILRADREPKLPKRVSRDDPRRVLERVILEALARPPCVVSFSGGRDSSAILAVAAVVARREGLPLPIPMTLRFQHAPATEESEWQEMVVRHLHLPEWGRREMGSELDLIGPLAAAVLQRHGPVYPPPAHFAIPTLRAATGGSLLRGDGGDELFTPRRRASRIANWNLPTTGSAPRRAARLLLGVAPYGVQRAVLPHAYARRHYRERFRWLRPAARTKVIAGIARRDATEPLRFDRYVRWLPRARAWTVRQRTVEVLAAETGTSVLDPFLDPDFLIALASRAGWRGLGTRAAAMRLLFADVLPDAILERGSKAEFTGAFFGPWSRAFAREWAGGGVDPSLVDPDALREIWASPAPDWGTFSLLQSAWLHGQSV